MGIEGSKKGRCFQVSEGAAHLLGNSFTLKHECCAFSAVYLIKLYVCQAGFSDFHLLDFGNNFFLLRNGY
jgi:hypothetical protein